MHKFVLFPSLNTGNLTSQEHFKECEKEAKMKPFAKAALAAGYTEKLDPTLEAKSEAQRWLRNTVSALAEQVEQLEVRCLLKCCSRMFLVHVS